MYCILLTFIIKGDLLRSDGQHCTEWIWLLLLGWIPAETAFVNPENIKPAAPACLANTTEQVECEQISDKYFTDPALLER